MHQVTASAIVDLGLEDTWQRLSDLSKPHYYVPDLTGTEITTEQTQGVGTSRRVYSQRPPLIETVTHWQDKKGFTLRLHHDKGEGVPPMFSRANFTYAIESVSDTQTKLVNTMEIEMKWGLFGRLLAKLIMNTMQKMQEQITVGQKLYYETGKKADKAAITNSLKEKS